MVENFLARHIVAGFFFAFVWARSCTALGLEYECRELSFLAVHILIFDELAVLIIARFTAYINADIVVIATLHKFKSLAVGSRFFVGKFAAMGCRCILVD